MGSIAVGALNVSEHGRLDESDVRAKIATEDGQVAQLAVAGADGRRRRHLVAAHAQMAVQILLKLVTEMAIGTFDQGLVSFRVGLDGQGSRIVPIRDSAIFLDETESMYRAVFTFPSGNELTTCCLVPAIENGGTPFSSVFTLLPWHAPIIKDMHKLKRIVLISFC